MAKMKAIEAAVQVLEKEGVTVAFWRTRRSDQPTLCGIGKT